MDVGSHVVIWQNKWMQMPDSDQAPAGAGGDPVPAPTVLPRPREIGGPPGPEPTRFGDWEKAGRCIDF